MLSAIAFLLIVGIANCDRQLLHHHESSAEVHPHRTHEEYECDKVMDYFMKNPVRKYQKQCFTEKLRSGDSIEFVIDVAPSPSLDSVDKMVTESPVGLYLEPHKSFQSTTRTFFKFISLFIDIVTLDMKPESTSSLIYENGDKFFIRGHPLDRSMDKEFSRDFSDESRNFMTLFPVSTKSVPDTPMAKVLNNNLGRMTKLALWNRDNGLPTVLSSSRNVKPIYYVVITDGSSGAKINDLTEDLSRTTVLDIGNNRFIDRLSWDEIRQLPSVLSVAAPQTLPSFANTVRNMACKLATNRSSK